MEGVRGYHNTATKNRRMAPHPNYGGHWGMAQHNHSHPAQGSSPERVSPAKQI